MGLTCYITTLGCSKNQVDSELLVNALEAEGFKMVSRPEYADAIIINTCGFIEAAQQESINAILEGEEFRREGRCRVLAVTGCLSQRYGEELYAGLQEIDIILGTGNFLELPGLLRNRVNAEKGPGQTLFRVGSPEEFSYPDPDKRTLLTPAHSVYLKIAEGCSNCCSYCVIPSIRGKYRSRPKEAIISEARLLLGQGAKEINLIAQDTSAYGLDFVPQEDLAGLLEDLTALDGVGWLRILYAYPSRISNKLLRVIRDLSGDFGPVCRYLDIPLQHVNENILASMNRQGSFESLYTLMSTIRDTVPDISLRTTFITGYPGETEKEFEELMSFVEKVQFDWVGVFPFSSQEGTPAHSLKPRVPKKEASKRAEALMSLQTGITEKQNLRHVGQILRVLVEDLVEDIDVDGDNVAGESNFGIQVQSNVGLNGESNVQSKHLLFTGRTEGQAPEVDGMVYISGASQRHIGEFVDVKITRVDNYDLVGEVSW